MAATRPTARLLAAAQDAGAKVIAIGDPGQLASVQAGGWLRAVGRQLNCRRLTEVMRQRDPKERRALAALHDHRPDQYLQWAGRAGRIHLHRTGGEARTEAIADWKRGVGEVGIEQAVLIARDNETRAALNLAAREARREAGVLGPDHRYGRRELAVGDRVICRRNDARQDVDNGTRGTIRHLDQDRVVIETDGRLIRQLPAGYAAEHVEHAYALTGHGMQGATVERATVVAHPHDLTAGWSYTALSRARGQTTLLIHDEDPHRDDHPPHRRSSASDTLTRVEQRMRVRDDEDLAIEQLPPAGRHDDRTLIAAERSQTHTFQERASRHAEPPVPDISPARLLELKVREAALRAQRDALPQYDLERLDALHRDEISLQTRSDYARDALSRLPPAPRLRHDRYAEERARLTAGLASTDEALVRTREHRARLEQQLGSPEQIRSEVDGLHQQIRTLIHQRHELTDQLIDRELAHPPAWVQKTLGQRPTDHTTRDWDTAARELARFRVEHSLTDVGDALGPEPAGLDERQDWRRAQRGLDRAMRRLDRGRGHDVGMEIDL